MELTTYYRQSCKLLGSLWAIEFDPRTCVNSLAWCVLGEVESGRSLGLPGQPASPEAPVSQKNKVAVS